MAPLHIEFLDEAILDAELAARWYFARSEQAAERFSLEIDAALQAIEAQPDAWPPYLAGTRRYLLKRFPYSIVYLVESSRIIVVAVSHSRRRPDF